MKCKHINLELKNNRYICTNCKEVVNTNKCTCEYVSGPSGLSDLIMCDFCKKERDEYYQKKFFS